METKVGKKTQYTVVLVVDGTRINTVEKEARAAFGGALRSVRKADPSRSRADRLSDIEGDVQSAAQDVEELKDELQEWYDNLPENFQNGDKGSELQEAIDALEEIQSGLSDIDFNNVSFPSMMG